ncbi:S-protein homolog 6-like [Hevea brasiliensis]|uniref:S-protein homolog 6-like n=1 Tax=Hevea brasiliensis TaxID=3981 RepID=UPI0025E3A831|nr:S-protein homolog 6-like [Hevea brasiliensis]XP_058002174.1 S-protein homolog 6-like [Hevea brasiliensis]
MNLFNKGASFLFLILFLIIILSLEHAPTTSARLQALSVQEKFYFFPIGTKVQIYNNAGEGENVTVHCKSKDNDLGTNVLQADQSFQWKFLVNFVETTLFFYSFTWRRNTGVYDTYTAKRDLKKRCPTKCIWKVFQNGVHGFRERTGKEDLYFRWNKTYV